MQTKHMVESHREMTIRHYDCDKNKRCHVEKQKIK